MAAKEIVFSQNARNEIAYGLNTLANAVKVTLGPRGRNVVIEKSWGSPTVTKDGVTVAKEVELEDKCPAVDHPGSARRERPREEGHRECRVLPCQRHGPVPPARAPAQCPHHLCSQRQLLGQD